jgi:acetyl-CoA carboxylase/biotin carboxylase 1
VIALRELSIRGDFQTTVEYLISLLETPSFQNNVFNTGWLDQRIAERVQTEKPDMMLAVLCGGLHVADQAILNSFTTFQTSLER